MKPFHQGALSVSAMLLLSTGCSFSMGSRFPESELSKLTYVSRNGDKAIDFPLSDKDIEAIPSWSPDQQAPLPISAIVGAASKELPKYIHGAAGWSLKEVSLVKITQPEYTGPKNKWIYLVSFSPSDIHNAIEIPVTVAGVPVQGKERTLDKREREEYGREQ